MITQDHHHGILGFLVWFITWLVALLGNLEPALRVILTLVGIVAGCQSFLYYRFLYREAKARKRRDS